jgi:hypothetical protein
MDNTSVINSTKKILNLDKDKNYNSNFNFCGNKTEEYNDEHSSFPCTIPKFNCKSIPTTCPFGYPVVNTNTTCPYGSVDFGSPCNGLNYNKLCDMDYYNNTHHPGVKKSSRQSINRISSCVSPVTGISRNGRSCAINRFNTRSNGKHYTESLIGSRNINSIESDSDDNIDDNYSREVINTEFPNNDINITAVAI